MIALRAEFVIKPGQEERVRETVEAILADSFGREREFLQAMVLVSEMETRLMTVLTFWHSKGFAEGRERRVEWLRKKLTPFVDQSPRVQSFCAQLLDGKNNAKYEESGSGLYSPGMRVFATAAS